MSTNKKSSDSKTLKKFSSSFIKQLLMIFIAITVIFPVYFMINTSFKAKMDYVSNKIGLPTKVIFSNFAEVFQKQSIVIWLMNSFIVTLGGVLVSTSIAALAAYAFSKINFIGKEKIFNFMITLMVIPPVVMVIPLFITMVKVNLVNTYYSAILIYSGLLIPFSVYLLRNFFITIPKSIIDSALIDGCSRLKAFIKIIVPLSAPALTTLIIVNALWVWNELLIALIFLQKTQLRTLMVGLTYLRGGRFRVNQPLIMAGLFISSIPMILLYLFGQKSFIRGMITGSLKGE